MYPSVPGSGRGDCKPGRRQSAIMLPKESPRPGKQGLPGHLCSPCRRCMLRIFLGYPIIGENRTPRH